MTASSVGKHGTVRFPVGGDELVLGGEIVSEGNGEGHICVRLYVPEWIDGDEVKRVYVNPSRFMCDDD